jgi:hypothetical protein
MHYKKDKSPKGFSLIKLALFLSMLLIVSGVAIYSFLDINPFDVLSDGFSGLYNRIFTTSAEQLKETVKDILEVDANEKISCAAASGDLVIAGISSVRIVDQEGMEKAYIPVSLKKPFVQSYGDGVIVADIEGRYFALINNGKIAWEKNIDEDIVNASISDTWVLLITKSKQSGYKRTIRVYSKDGQEISFRNVSNYYPFMAANYPGYNKACFVISSIETSGLEANGLFEFLDLSMNQKASIKGAKEIFGKGFPLEKESLFIYSERSIMAVDSMYRTIWHHKTEGSKVTAANVVNKKFPVVALLDTNVLLRERRNETTVRIYNNNGTEKDSFVLMGKVTGISVKEKTAAVIAESEVFFINQDGSIMDQYTARSDIQGVYLSKDDTAYIVTSDLITRVKIKTDHKFLGIF